MLRRGGSSSMRDEFGDEISRLRFRLRRLYAIRRHVTRAHPDLDLVESAIMELIRDAENGWTYSRRAVRPKTQSAERHLHPLIALFRNLKSGADFKAAGVGRGSKPVRRSLIPVLS